MYLSRKGYLEKIRSYMGKTFVKVIVGQRRIGKTVIMKQIIEILPKNEVVYINKEDKNFDFLYDENSLNEFLENKISEGVKYIFVDEIQMIKNWENCINSIFSKNKIIDIIISGSNSQLLSSELTTKIAGRFVAFNIYAFSYSEYLEYFNESVGANSFKTFIDDGGLPSVYPLPDNTMRCEWVENLINTVFLKDIITRYKIKDILLLKEIFLFLVNNIGNITNLASIIKYLKNKMIKTNLNTLSSYVESLKSTYLIFEANVFDLQGKGVFDRERKFYISDHILRKCLFSGFDKGYGKILENIVFMEALRNNYRVYVGRIKDKEVDFVLEHGGVKKYIQVAYLLPSEDTIKREFGNLELIKDNYEKYVVTMDEVDFGNINGVKHIKIWELDKIFRGKV